MRSFASIEKRSIRYGASFLFGVAVSLHVGCIRGSFHGDAVVTRSNIAGRWAFEYGTSAWVDAGKIYPEALTADPTQEDRPHLTVRADGSLVQSGFMMLADQTLDRLREANDEVTDPFNSRRRYRAVWSRYAADSSRILIECVVVGPGERLAGAMIYLEAALYDGKLHFRRAMESIEDDKVFVETSVLSRL